jgi:hypothetical protein
LKQTLLLIAVFAVAFGATLLLSRDLWKPIEVPDRIETPDGGGPDADLRSRRGDVARTMINQPGAPAQADVVVEAGESSEPASGSIEGEARTDDGLDPGALKVMIHPANAEPRLLGGGRFHVDKLPPGTYYVSVAAEGYVTRRAQEVNVEAGKSYKVELGLERGFELRGIVVEDVDQRPIAGASIDFNGLVQATSDATGSFRTTLVTPKALDIITITHDDYDRTYLIHPVIPEPTGITLAMSRGKGTITGRILAPSGEPPPPQIRVRVWRIIMENYEEVRRDRTWRDATSFEIKGVFDGTNVLEISFPGSTYATRRIEFDLARQPALHFDVDLNDGGAVEGTFVSVNKLVAHQPVTLMDTRNHPMGETRTDAEGKFRFDRVAAGDYAIRMDVGVPQINTQHFRVEAGKTSTITVDGQLGRLK